MREYQKQKKMSKEISELLELVKALKTKMITNQSYELASQVRDIEKQVEALFNETPAEAMVVKFNDEKHLEEFLMNLRIQQPE